VKLPLVIAPNATRFHKVRMRCGTLLSLLTLGATALNATGVAKLSPLNAPEIVSGFALRDRYKLPKHLNETAIYIDSVSVHHVRSEASTIVWRDAAGHWQRDQAVEIGPGGLLAITRNLESHETRSLTGAEAQAVERLIKKPTLYRSRVRSNGKAKIGMPLHVMATVTTYGQTTVKWTGRLGGESGKIADIALGRD